MEKTLRQTFDEILGKESSKEKDVSIGEALIILCMVYENTEKIKEKLDIN